MDEPLSNLDAKLRVQMRADISKLQRELSTTTIYVTHDQVEAMTMGDRVAVMNQGELQQVDAPQRLYDEPANLFVAGFIGTPPMNLLQGNVHVDNGSVSVDLGLQRLALPERALSRYPAVRRLDGRTVIIGLRSEDLHSAAGRPDLPTLTGKLELVEALGPQSVAYFRVEAEALRTQTHEEEEEEIEETHAEGVTATRPNLVATLPARDAMGLRIDDDVPVAVDVARAHLFDSEGGAPLR
jgi:multiple sugar transport system ATP-binding protein